jgi:hypothetical protein
MFFTIFVLLPSLQQTLQVLFMVSSGFFLSLDDVPAPLGFLKVVSPQRFAFEALMVNEFTGLELSCLEDEYLLAPELQSGFDFCPFIYGEEILDVFAFDSERLWFNIAILWVLFFLYRCLAFLAFKYRSKHFAHY